MISSMDRIVFLDFETYPVKGKSFLMEIGCVVYANGAVSETYHTMIRPVAKVSNFVLRLTGIHEADLLKAPLFADVMDDFYTFIGDSVVVAHNAPLDRLSYEQTCAHHGMESREFKWIDSQDVVKIMHPDCQSLQLQALLAHFNITLGAKHRALDDAKGLGELFLTLQADYAMHFSMEEWQIVTQNSHMGLRYLLQFITQFFRRVAVNHRSINTDEMDVPPSLLHPRQAHHVVAMPTHDASDSGCMVIVSRHCDAPHPVIYAESDYVIPPAIATFYPIFSSKTATYSELVEVIAIMNWIRQTTTYLKRDLNENLWRRYTMVIGQLIPIQKKHKIHFLTALFRLYTQQSPVITCHVSTFLVIVVNAPKQMWDCHIVWKPFMALNQGLIQERSGALTSEDYKPLWQIVVLLSGLVTVQKDSVSFIRDVAKIRHRIGCIHDEKQTVFSRVDALIAALSVTVCAKRQVLMNQYVKETVEWQQLQKSMGILLHHLRELVRLIRQLRLQLDAIYDSWITDVVSYIRDLTKRMARVIGDTNDAYGMYLESLTNNRPKNCSIVWAPINNHAIYDSVAAFSKKMTLYQPFIQHLSLDHLGTIVGMPLISPAPKSAGHLAHVAIFTANQGECKQWVVTKSRGHHVVVVCNDYFGLKAWKRDLYALVKSSTTTIAFFTIDQLEHAEFPKNPAVIFPDVDPPTTLNPLFRRQLESMSMDEPTFERQLVINYVYALVGLVTDLGYSQLAIAFRRAPSLT
jgi:DNA polymerase-3 subunit epsilon